MATEEYKLSFTPLAEVDLQRIFEYISLNLSAPKAARELMRKIEEAFSRLTRMHFSAPACEDDILREKGYRKLVVNNYIAIYSVDDILKTVIVLRVFYGGQNYHEYL